MHADTVDAPTSPRQCVAILKNGKRCSYKARPGTPGMCMVHTPRDADECPVCLQGMIGVRKTLRCGHVFHVRCLRQWFARGEGTCPMCRAPTLCCEPDIAQLSSRLATFVGLHAMPDGMHYSEHVAGILRDKATHQALGMDASTARLLYEILLQSFSLANFYEVLEQCGF